MLTVGLTGGIGSGKSTVAARFSALGTPVIDTDNIAHALTDAGQPALELIAKALGPQAIASDGSLDRPTVRRVIFADPGKRKILENILHPLIREQVSLQRAQLPPTPYCIVVVPLLFETDGYAGMIDRTLLVDCPVEQQIIRTMARSHLSETEVRDIIQVQMPRDQKRQLADDIITNDGSEEALRNQVDQKHEIYLSLA